jgi:predicted DNA-binding transcriptional regulator YafY
MNRIDRLTAMLIHLQSKKVVKAEEMSNRFEISLRTVYRDVKALMEGGVPIGSEAGKGYFIVDGYHLPPVMFTQDEASSMMMAGKFVEKMTDKSVRKAFESAMYKIKAVLSESEKDHLDHLQSLIEVYVSPRSAQNQGEFPDHFITEIQRAVVQKQVLKLDYISNTEELTSREVEPIGLFYYSAAWHLIAWCRLRNGYRDFRADRIKDLKNTTKNFEGRNLLSLQEYFRTMFQANEGLVKAIIVFDKASLRGKPVYGSISQTDLGTKIRAEFMMDNVSHMARWLMMFGSAAEVEEPELLRTTIAELAEELVAHYGKIIV